jgi:hypothetical protein
MKFKVKPNVLPKNIKLFQKYIDEESSYDSSEESSYYSDESSYDSSEEYTTSSGSSNSESCDGSESEYSYESVSTTTRNFAEFLKEYSKIRDYRIKNDPLMIDYIFDTDKVGGKWKRHTDKSIRLYNRYLNVDKESIKNGDPMFIRSKVLNFR